MTSRIREAVMGLPPGAFAFVMATGILSVGLSRQELAGASRVGLVLAGTAWVALLMLTAGRLLWYRDRVVADIHDPGRAFGFFTLAAGTNVLAVRLTDDYRLLAVGLLALGFVTGLLLALRGALDRSPVPDRATGAVRGRWDLVHLGGRRPVHRHRVGSLEPLVSTGRGELAVVAVVAWSVGIVLYAACAVFMALRLMLYPLRPRDLDPPYWVAMGAAAITGVAGARIVEMTSAPMVDATAGLISGLTVLWWAWATWLIPLLISAGVWRHVVHHIPLRYESSWWSVVFPLGMYAVAGMYVGRADSLPIVEQIGAAWMWVALLAWLVATAMMVWSWFRPRHGERADDTG
ncbi:tellurite resistance/C4-dicarboxylate transporter family protein [Dietzia sp. E1]|uniref:tellurite resistance/C4-dicarboxylate transporter family protein n=1 Tax=Dietzia sp. E1 TaxID=328361 RepID=UPI00321F7AEF